MSDAATIAEALEGRWEGRQYRCRCPVHGGRSLMVRDGDNGPLVHCFGGCEAGAILSQLRSMNLIEELPEDRKAAYKARKRQEDVDQAKRIVLIAHEGPDTVCDRFGRSYRWARKVLKNAGYEVRMVPRHRREFPEQRVEIVERRSR